MDFFINWYIIQHFIIDKKLQCTDMGNQSCFYRLQPNFLGKVMFSVVSVILPSDRTAHFSPTSYVSSYEASAQEH